MVTGPNNPEERGSVKLNDLIAALVVKVYLPVLKSFPPSKPFLNVTVLTFASGVSLSPNKRLIHRFATSISINFLPPKIDLFLDNK